MTDTLFNQPERPPRVHERDVEFRHELCELMNRYSVENGSNTPDFILADYVIRCLETFNTATLNRDSWYRNHENGEPNAI